MDGGTIAPNSVICQHIYIQSFSNSVIHYRSVQAHGQARRRVRALPDRVAAADRRTVAGVPNAADLDHQQGGTRAGGPEDYEHAYRTDMRIVV